jgi:hypothetical protein
MKEAGMPPMDSWAERRRVQRERQKAAVLDSRKPVREI